MLVHAARCVHAHSVCCVQYEAEEAVREEFPDAIIFRSADMWGMEDRFLNYYASRCE